VEAQELLDRLFKPFEDLLVEAVVAASAARVLDIGCGTGGTTLAFARRLGSNGRCVGIDISDAMIAAACDRAERSGTSASFIRADAQVHAFEPASFDLIVSRFGVMFFDDSIHAFANLRRAARDNAALRFIAWRSAAENPFMTTAERAATPLFPNISARHPGAPGQFAFADQHHVSGILKASGWAEIDIQPIDVACTMPEKELAGFFTRLGSLGRMLDTADEPTRAHVIQTVRPAFDPYVHRDHVHFNAACWMVSAQAPSSSTAP
jgi:ubiquinone/menaquinone biosynthesis C-methylase UbiE